MKHAAPFILTLVALFALVGLTACSDEEEPAAEPSGNTAEQAGAPADEGESIAADSSSAAQTVADINGTTIQGELFSLVDHRGAVVVVNFFATWCGPCRAEIPDLIELNREYGDELVLVGVSLDDTADVLPGFIAETGIDYPVLHLDALTDPEAVMGYYTFSAIPTTFMVHRDGTPGEMIVGSRDKATFREIFEGYL
ncbi:MAG: redoxin domain-containing protein [Candidatus Coatesbacteria bacterium]|nr:redoxin domain-containing protein [Candidatus Coatesbacteria bacterium]